MIKKAYLRDLGEGGEPFSEIDVGLAGLGVARRMVVRHHDGDRAPFERLLEHVASEGRSGVSRAARDAERFADGAVLVVQQEGIEVLLVVARHEDGLEHFVGVIWIGHLLRTEFAWSEAAPAASHLEGCGEFEALDMTKSLDRAVGMGLVPVLDALLQRAPVAGDERFHGSERLDEAAREFDDVQSVNAGLEENSDKSLIWDERRICGPFHQLARHQFAAALVEVVLVDLFHCYLTAYIIPFNGSWRHKALQKTSCRAAYEKFGDGSTKDISNELPFALPNGWVWTRIGNVCYDFQYGTARKSTKNGNVPVLRMGNLRAGEIDYSDLVYTSDKDDIERYCLNPGDLLFNRTNSSEKVGKVSIFRGKKPCIYAGYLVRFRPVRSDSEFINYMMNSRYQWEFCQSVKTDAVNQSNISASKFIQFLVPLPPLAEQKRIVAKIKELFMVADLLDATTNNLMNTSKQIDKKILDLAIRGKLMSQDPNDEPASEIVKRIAASHKSPSKNQSEPIDPPFAIPQSWEWVRLKDLGVFCSGHTPSTSNPNLWGGDMLWVSSKDMKSKYIDDTQMKVTQLGAEELNVLKPGTLLMCTRSGILRRVFPIAIARRELTINQDQRALTLWLPEMIEYVYLALKSLESIILSDYKKSGTTVESIIWNKFVDLPIPLPPLNEQKRIVKRVDEFKALTRMFATS